MVFKQKYRLRGLTLAKIKTNYKAIIIKMVGCWNKIETYQYTRRKSIESSNIDFFYKGAKTKWGKNSISTNNYGTNGYSQA